MSDNKFDTNEETQAILADILMRGALAVPDGLSAASLLSDGARAYLAEQLEQKAIPKIIGGGYDVIKALRYRAEGLEYLRKTDLKKLRSFKQECDTYINTSQLIAFVYENRGDKATPFVQMFAEEAAKLSDAEYALPENHIKILCNAMERSPVIPPPDAPKTNPFRKKGPGIGM